MTTARELANDVQKELKTKMSAKRRKLLERLHMKIDKWARALEEDDVEALIELSEEHGLFKKEKLNE